MSDFGARPRWGMPHLQVTFLSAQVFWRHAGATGGELDSGPGDSA